MGVKNEDPKKPSRKSWLYYYFVVLVITMLLNALVFPSFMARQVHEVTYDQFLDMIDQGRVEEVAMQDTQITFRGKDEKGGTGIYKTGLWPDEGLMERLHQAGVAFAKEIPTQASPLLTIFMSWIMPILMFVVIGQLLSRMLMKRMGGMGNAMTFGKSNAKIYAETETGKTFADVAGQEEAKEALREIVDFLHNPQKYADIGAILPKGALLVGPPGTGKTLLAKAVAGEAHVPFFSISGSEFVEMFVGMGAAKVRDLFKQANEKAPCIVFIDEIDAVARRRGSGLGGGHDEREQTLNQMLVEMDGFGINEGIIVMAATNRVDILDPAILRPGRFDRRIHVGLPDVRGREDILKVHAKNKPLGEDVDLGEIARTTAGFAGADLENLLNESAIAAARDNRGFIVDEDIRKSFIKVGIGAEKKSKIISDKDKRITAFHEAGHAILFHLLPDVGPVYTVSVIPTGQGAAGYTMPLPEKDEMHLTKGKMLQDITVCLGGRIAEKIAFDDVTTGAVQDIRQATEAARDMVTKYGFSDELGMINYSTSDDEVFIGRDIGHTKNFSESTSEVIDREVKKIVDGCHDRATKLLEENVDVLNRLADLLIEKERIGQEEFEALFEQNDDTEQ